MSRGDVVTRPLSEVDSTPHDGHAGAVSSAVATCTTRVPSAKRSTRSTRTPGNPNNNVVPSDKALGPFVRLNASQLSDFRRPRAPYCNDTPVRAKSQLPV